MICVGAFEPAAKILSGHILSITGMALRAR